ncbi:hypothetical protein B0H13DRAFT_2279913, partial [Mycena leptocephala]
MRATPGQEYKAGTSFDSQVVLAQVCFYASHISFYSLSFLLPEKFNFFATLPCSIIFLVASTSLPPSRAWTTLWALNGLNRCHRSPCCAPSPAVKILDKNAISLHCAAWSLRRAGRTRAMGRVLAFPRLPRCHGSSSAATGTPRCSVGRRPWTSPSRLRARARLGGRRRLGKEGGREGMSG